MYAINNATLETEIIRQYVDTNRRMAAIAAVDSGYCVNAEWCALCDTHGQQALVLIDYGLVAEAAQALGSPVFANVWD